MHGKTDAVNPEAHGTKAAACYSRSINTGETITLAAWDLGCHCLTLTHVDPQLAKEQILLMLREWYMHPSGQIPGYEWEFK